MADIDLNIGGNTRQLDKDIQKSVNKVYNINLKTKGEQPLGRITGKVNEFTKSLDASNARVIAFGASAGIIYGVQKAFSALITSTIEVQKSLQDINVILNVSNTELNKFGSDLFSIAKNTGQSFDEVAKAATEFSRQGLGVAETLKRTSDALILSRLSGLDAAKSVEALTAAVNSFASQAVTASDVVNKFANVDAAFAVSSADLAEAISRVGSSAAQSGVNLNELIAIVTSAQQTTARGGAVIGNSFKTIFTRLERGKVQDLLGTLGISTTDSSGQLKSTIQLLQDLGKVYDTLGSQQQSYVAEQVGGVFQINILKAALADLGKEQSIYSSALNVAASSTDQAIRRNEELNKTYAAQINVLQQNATQIASMAGERLLGPSIDRVVGGSNLILGAFNESDGQGVGAILGKGILDGIGQFISGPGLALVGGVLIKLFGDLAKFATGSVQQLLGLNTGAAEQKALQESISNILQKNPALIDLALKGEQGLAQAANVLLSNLQKQTVELEKQAAISAQISKAFYSGGVRLSGGVPTAPLPKTGKAAGYIPNFVSDRAIEKADAIALGATPSVRPHMSKGTIGGRKFVMNNQETEYPRVGRNGDSMVIPHYAARGFIPNFVKSIRDYKVTDGDSTINLSDGKQGRLQYVDAIEKWQKYGGKALSLAENILPAEFPNLESLLKSSTSSAAYNRYSFKSSQLQNALIKQGLGVPDIRYSGSNYQRSTLQAMNQNIGLWSDKNKEGFYNHPKAQQFIKQNNLEKKLSSQPNIDKNKKNFILGSATRFGTGRFGGKLLPNKYKSGTNVNFQNLLARGFIPNFANTGTGSVIDLGDIAAGSAILKGKVASLIYPGESSGIQKVPVQSAYRGQKFKGLLPTAGINKGQLKQGINIPNVVDDVEQMLLNQANNFGQVLGSSGLPMTPLGKGELPNTGAVKGAAGVAFEGGVKSVVQKSLQAKTQNANIDFAKPSSKLKNIFNNAPGVYDAKYTPELADDVLTKLLRFAQPAVAGVTKQVTSGPGFKEYQVKRQAALDEIKKSGVSGSVNIKKALKDKGFARGFIPNFSALQDAISREQGAGIPKSQIYIAQHKGLAAGYNPLGLGVFNKIDEPTSGARDRAIKNRGKATGFIPNFAIEDPDTKASSLGEAFTALGAQVGTLAFAFAFNGDRYKESLKQLTAANVKAARENLQTIREKIPENPRLNRPFGPLPEKQQQIYEQKLQARQQAIPEFIPQVKEGREKIKAAEEGSKAQKAGAGLQANALGVSIALPILAETVKNIAGQETAGARKTGAVAGALGQVGSFAATGAMIAGPEGAAVGAGIGAAVGALLSVDDVIKSFVSDFPEFNSAAKKAAENLSKFNDAVTQLAQASNVFTEALNDGVSGADAIKRAQEDFANSIRGIKGEYQDKLLKGLEEGNFGQVSADVSAQLLKDKQNKEAQASRQNTIDASRKSDVYANILNKSSGVGLISQASNKYLGTDLPNWGDMFSSAYNTNSSGTRQGREQRDVEKQNILEKLTQGKTSDEAIKSLQNIKLPAVLDGARSGVKLTDEARKAAKENFAQIETPEDFKKFLEDLNAFDATDISQFVEQASQGGTSLSNTASLFFEAIQSGLPAFIKARDSAKELADATEQRNTAEKKYNSAIQATLINLQKNIEVQNIYKNALDNASLSAKTFQDNLAISQKYTAPKEALGGIFQDFQGSYGAGRSSSLEKQLSLNEGLAKSKVESNTNIGGIANEFKDSIRQALEPALTEKRGEVLKPESLKGVKTGDIDTKTAEVQQKLLVENQKFNAAQSKIESLMGQFVSGQIDQANLTKGVGDELGKLNITTDKAAGITSKVELAIATSGAKLFAEQQRAQQQLKLLATESVQKLIQDQIAQSLGVMGGVEGFMNRPETAPQGEIARLEPLIGKIEGMRSDVNYRYNSKESIKESEKNAPELGRQYIKFYQELNKLSGGGFRDMLQKRVDTEGQQLTRGKGGQLSKTGGFDDIVRGIQVDIDNQLKQAEDRIKTTKDPGVKRDLQDFVSSIKKLGTGNVAKLQAQSATGVARQSDFQDVYKKYENASLEKLKGMGPAGEELAKEFSKNTSYDTSNPLLAEAQLQSGYQVTMIGFLQGIQDAIIKTAQGDTANIKGFDIKSLLSKPEEQAVPAENPQINKNLQENQPTPVSTVNTNAATNVNKAPLTPEQELFDYKRSLYSAKPKGQEAFLQNSDDRAKLKNAEESGLSPEQILKQLVPKSIPASAYGVDSTQLQIKPEEQKAKTAPITESFTQGDAALNSNTAAITTLTTSIDGLKSKFDEASAMNQTAGATAGTKGQTNPAGPASAPNISTNTSAPVNVVVNAQGGSDIAAAVGEAVQNAIPTIIEKVRIAMGEKVPPSVPKNVAYGGMS